jgi:hypothetical protein
MGNPVIEPAKRPAIESDDVASAERDIGQISAKDFLNILDKEGLGSGSLNLLPEKKKYELYLEPEWTKAIKVKDLVRVLKAEKKKVELELPFDLGARVNPPYTAFQPGGYAHPGSYATQAAYGGGASGYPTDDQTRWWPPQIEMRKASLDHRFELVSSQIAQLHVTIQELKAKLEHAVNR